MVAFELVKAGVLTMHLRVVDLPLHQVRRQLEYSIAETKGIHIVKPPNTLDAVRDIFRANGIRGLYTGFRLHCRESFDVI